MRLASSLHALAFVLGSLGGGLAGCGRETAPPVARPAASVVTIPPGPAPSPPCSGDARPAPVASLKLMEVPRMPDAPARDGDVFSVAAAVHAFRSAAESEELARGPITIEGFIIDTNLGRAPKCALHRRGVPSPPNCKAELPTFLLGERRGQMPDVEKRIRVIGWASSFPEVLTAEQGAASGKKTSDDRWGVEIPIPLPAVGAKVRVTGRYGAEFSKSAHEIVLDPFYGIVTYESMQVLEPAPKPAKLGG